MIDPFAPDPKWIGINKAATARERAREVARRREQRAETRLERLSAYVWSGVAIGITVAMAWTMGSDILERRALEARDARLKLSIEYLQRFKQLPPNGEDYAAEDCVEISPNHWNCQHAPRLNVEIKPGTSL